MLRRHIWVGLCILAVSGFAGARSRALPNIDNQSERAAQAPRELTPAERQLVQAGRNIQYDSGLGVPTFLWAAPSSADEKKARAVRVLRAPDAVSEARRHAAAYASFYGLDHADIQSAEVDSVHDTGEGAIIVKFHEKVGGIEVFREEMSVMMDRGLERIALSGYLGGAAKQLAASGSGFSLDERAAVALALADRTGRAFSAGELATTDKRQGPYGYVGLGAHTMRAIDSSTGSGEAAPLLSEPARYKKVYFHAVEGYEAAYYIEVSAELTDEDGKIDNDLYAYVISARDGRILYRQDLTVSDSYAYRVFAETSGPSGLQQPLDSPHGDGPTPNPTGIVGTFSPIFVSPNLNLLENIAGTITGKPWLPTPATLGTVGNNVDAYADLFLPNGFSPTTGDFRADLTSTGPPGTFDRTYDVTKPPLVLPLVNPAGNPDQIKASITNLFYIDNFLHDWFYVAGFDEAGRNAQTDNFGLGGLGNDPINAEAEDNSGRNNANMSTPADGGRPRQQMFVFDGGRSITVTGQPGGGTLLPVYRNTQTGISSTFGTQFFSVTAEVLRAVPADGCSAPIAPGSLTGKIAFIDRGGVGGTCVGGFAQKARNAQDAGAIGVIIANVDSSATPGTPPGMAGTTPTSSIGALSLNNVDGNAWRATLALGTVTATLFRDVDRDGSLDSQVVEHEWGHYITNRLVGNAAGLGNQQGGGMGEGWGDFNAMLLTVRPEDTAVAVNDHWQGVYTMGAYASVIFSPDTYYFGIRRVPYSTDMTKDPLTFKHIQNGTPLPCATVPINASAAGCAGTNNSEVHNVGEVWSTMLWECLTSLLNNHPFDVARDRMRNYLVTALKMTPISPTILEARDAMLAAAFATDPNDFVLFCQAFAKRGAGRRAIGPARTSTTLVGVTESFVCGNDLQFVSASLGAPTSCDGDGYLDNFESATLSVTLKNIGAGAMTATTATVSSPNPAIHFANGGVINFPNSGPFETTTGTILVSMSGAVGIQDFAINISFDDPSIGLPPQTASILVRGNADDLLNASASDNVEANATAWTLGGFGGTWQRVRDTITPNVNNFVWNGPDPNNTADLYLISPTLNVGATTFSFTFKHRFMFENATTFFDGGVVEISTDGGTTWADVNTGGVHLSPNYNHTLVAGGTNPIQGRPAYSGNSSGYPAFATVTCSLGTAFNGMAVKIRFRVGADLDTGPAGWDIDDLVFSGITNTPFSVIVAQPAEASSTVLDPAFGVMGNPTTLHATVSACGTVPTGSVQFQINKGAGFVNVGGPVTLVNGEASTIYTVDVGAGVYPTKAIYTPDIVQLLGSTGTSTLTVTRGITALSPAKVWIGLKNSDDVGLRLDLKVQIFTKIGATETMISEKEADNVASGSTGFNNAILNTLTLSLASSAALPPGASVEMAVSARRTCANLGHASGTPRLWYNNTPVDSGAGRHAGSRFDLSLDSGSSTNYYLRPGLLLSTANGTSDQSVDKFVDSSLPCPARPFISFGTWAVPVP